MEVISEYLREEILRLKQEARSLNQRRMLIFLSHDEFEFANFVNSFLRITNEDFLIVTDEEALKHNLNESSHLTFISHKDTKKILGRTFNNAIIDLRRDLDVISMSRAVETVRGGGLIILIMPFSYGSSQRYIQRLKPIGVSKSPRDLLRRRILQKAFEIPGISIFSQRSLSFIKRSTEKLLPKYNDAEGVETRESKSSILKPEGVLYNLCKTEDQKLVLGEFKKLNDTNYLLIIADRGRGKSAAVGIGITAYAYMYAGEKKERLNTIVTAPEIENTIELFNFVEISHKALNLPYVREGTAIKSSVIDIKYLSPFDSLSEKADILIVEEAAGMQFPLLSRLIKKFSKIVFVSTIHGYEGAGRTFSVRFIPMLKESGKAFKLVPLNHPIRYNVNDPIEKWLFESLLLNAEPADIDSNLIIKKRDNVLFRELNPMELIYNDQLLKHFFGILVVAHYRNNPNDLLMLLDAPHHRGFALVFDETPIVALQVSEEGGIREEDHYIFYETAPASHIIPDKLFKYYGLIDALSEKGWRIVRIATHPRLMRKGFGSKALKFLEKVARENNIAWIGAGFSAYPELLAFWLKNEFLPIHLSPKVNRKTGEHTIIVIKPIKEELRKDMIRVNKELKLRILKEAATTFKYLDPKTMLQILKTGEIIGVNINLSSSGVFKLNLYLKGILHFESVSDVVEDLVKWYFSSMLNFLSYEQELLLIRIVLQRKKAKIRDLLKLRRIIQTIWNKFITQ